jgi:DNA-binding transcriptional LysR family regulator
MTDAFKTINWDEFRLIKAIADARGLPGAAAQTGLNHSTVFRRLGQIESALGVMLFERHRTGYALTPAGEEIVALAGRLDTDITSVTRKLAGRELQPAGELRLTTNDSLLVHLLTPLFARFRRQCRDVRLDIVLSNQSLNLSKRDADVAIRATDNPPENLFGRRIARIAWALYASAEDAPQVDMDALYDRPWVSMGDNLAMLKAVQFVQQHVAPERIAYKVNTVLGLAEAVEAGIGIGYLPCFIGDARSSLVRLTPPQPDYGTDLWFLTHPDLRHSARVRVLFDFMTAEIGALRPLLEGQQPHPPD